MPTTYKPQDSIRKNNEPGFRLQDSDKLIVDRGIVISSVLFHGVEALGHNQITVVGTVGGSHGIFGSDTTVDVRASGVVSGEHTGVTNTSGDFHVTNSGIISATYQGIAVYGSGTIENSGVIESGTMTSNLNSAIYLGSTHKDTEIINTGVIEARLADAYAILSTSGETTSDRVLNSGTIKGNVSLGGGDDSFNTANGRVHGTIDGGAGEDNLKGSKFNDVLIGGTGNDRLTGNKGSDVFELVSGAGNDVITDFDAIGGGEKQDYLSLPEGMEYTEKSVHNGRDTILDFGDGHVLTLLNVKAADFSKADIDFDI